jgi:hypothetical protein
MATRTKERETLMRVRDIARELDQSLSAVYCKIAARDRPSVRLGSSQRAPIRVPERRLTRVALRRGGDMSELFAGPAAGLRSCRHESCSRSRQNAGRSLASVAGAVADGKMSAG